MPKYQVTAPDGTKYEVTAPDGATQEQAIAYVQAQHHGQNAAAQPDMPTQTLPDTNVVAQDQPSLGRQLLNSTLQAGGNVVKGVGSLADLPIDALNAGVAKFGGPENYFQTIHGLTDKGLQASGVPQPSSPTERVIGRVEQGLGGLVGGMGLGGAMSSSASPVARAVGTALQSHPGAQLASAAAGATAGGVAHEAGAGPKTEMALSLLGGLAPSTVTDGIPAAVRAAFRGGEAGRQTVQSNLENFAAAGTTPTVGQATENVRTRGLESLLSKTPGAVGLSASRAAAKADEIGQGLDNLASTLSKKKTAMQAGLSVNHGVTGPAGFVQTTKKVANALYDKLGQHINPGQRVDVGNTMQALQDLNAAIPGAPALSKFFQNAKIMGIEDAFKNDTQGIKAVLTRPGMQEKADALRAQFQADAARQRASLESQAQAQATENARLESLNLKPNTAPMTKAQIDAQVPSSEAIDAKVNDFLKSQVDSKIPYEALKKIRTLVGDEIDNSSIMSDVPRSKWKAVYAALSKDLEASATTPEAKQALSRANGYFKARLGRMEILDSAIEKNGGPEKVFKGLFSGAQDGNTTLRAVFQSIPKDAQKDLAAAFLRKMGRATAGNQTAEGEQFSANTFLTNWNKISPEAKATVFGRFGPQFSADMEKIAKVASNLRDGSRYLANPSGSAVTGAQLGTVGAFVMSLLNGHIPTAATIAGGTAWANLSARVMTNPSFVRWLAQRADAPVLSLPAQIQALQIQAQKQGDQDLSDAAKELKKVYQSNNGKANQDQWGGQHK